MRTVFVVLPNVLENEAAAEKLHQAFDRVVVASERSVAVSELVDLGSSVDAAVVGVKERIDASVLDKLPNLRAIGSVSAGTDHIDVPAVQSRGVKLVTSGNANSQSVAEHALAMILCIVKRLREGHAASLSGADRAGMVNAPHEFRGMNVGILGAGATAQALLRLLQPFGVNVLVWTRNPASHPEILEYGAENSGLDKIFGTCNVVSIHLPLTDETRHMVDGRLLNKLPKNACVVNVARKDIFDLGQLTESMVDRPDLSLAVDDFGLAGEDFVSRLDDRFLVTPHVAGVTVEAERAMQNIVVDGVIRTFE
ncbi:NAD(P)-dependent oxidoreductase [Actinoplanes rectilineatus]|uniref:NAD(P)-dependent oxidoreductase n=1 Tax=Actinoplanes rectilineatus TaxID=113571 RepID=UPI000B2BFE77|nr:NAD(P)-dependent oxidoreductase [Actinoplanes rectilineatus]